MASLAASTVVVFQPPVGRRQLTVVILHKYRFLSAARGAETAGHVTNVRALHLSAARGAETAPVARSGRGLLVFQPPVGRRQTAASY